jgi:excisionase family DNA binding protein
MPIEQNGQTYYSVKELSQVLAASEEFITKHVTEGRIEGKQIDGEWHISEEALQRFFDGD